MIQKLAFDRNCFTMIMEHGTRSGLFINIKNLNNFKIEIKMYINNS